MVSREPKSCPFMFPAWGDDDASVVAADCMGSRCALWLGDACAVAYIGADCKRSMTRWRCEHGDGRDERR